MLEIAEVGRTISERAYKRALPDLREQLLAAQFDLAKSARGPLLVLLSGIEGGGRSETANHLTSWMDPRHIRTVAFGPRTPEEDAHPIAWRYWQALPARGTIGIFMNAWYREAVRYHGKPGGHARFEYLLDEIRHHEAMLAADGFLLLKLWFHLSEEAAARRLDELRQDKNRLEPIGRARKEMDAYFARRSASEELLRQTSMPHAPWHVVEGADPRYRDLTTGRLVLDALRAAAAPRARPPAPRATTIGASTPELTLLDTLDLSARISDPQYDELLPSLQQKLARLTRRKRFRKRALVLVFEGVDAAGKGGAIRRVTGALDARQYRIDPVSAPNEEEKLYPYLWRFWRQVPRKGGITLFDRSWYGRVLVERVEGFCTPADWHRAYGEINQFEENLAAGGIVVCKFWLQISKAEQLARFRARQKTTFKQFKITSDDWRNRKRWNDYRAAANDMIERTSSEIAPWTLVAAEDKRCARIQVLQTIVDRLDAALG